MHARFSLIRHTEKIMEKILALVVVASAAALAACDPPGEKPSPASLESVSAGVLASPSPAPTSSEPAPSSAAPSDPSSAVPDIPAANPLVPPEQRRAAAASLLMPAVVNYDDALAKLQAGVGGIFIVSWADPGLLTQPGRDLHALREAVGRDFEVSIDFEGGRVQRFSEVLGSYPSAQQMAHGTPEQVEGTAFQIGQTLAAYGITLDFAPVLDVGGADLDVVGDRAYSTDPVRAGEYGAAFARGLENAGVDAVFKHFPGHGRASGDTHLGAAVTPPLPEMEAFDIVPWDGALPGEPRADAMVGHMVVPGLGNGVTPSSLNPAAYELLRTREHFGGRIFTDDLTGMAAITSRYTPEQAIVTALASGADVALWSTATDINFIIDQVVGAVEVGIIPEQRFADAVAHSAAGLAPR